MSTNKKNTKKLDMVKLYSEDNKDYVKPKQSFTERLSEQEIADLLSDYVETKADDLTHGAHIRYLKKNKDTKKYEFRMGGTIFKIEDDYFTVSNGKYMWSVQKAGSIFYKKMSFVEKEKEFENTLFNKNKEIKGQAREIKEHKLTIAEQNKELKQKNLLIQKLIDEREKLNSKIKLLEKKLNGK